MGVQVGKPVHSQLAERLPSAEAIIAKMGTIVAQYKYDGLRAQIHKDGEHVTIYSRNLEDQSHMFPELIEGTRKQIRAEQVILDVEALPIMPPLRNFFLSRKRPAGGANTASRP
jgi:DNA ligase 1